MELSTIIILGAAGALWTLLTIIVGSMINSMLKRISRVENKVSEKVSTVRLDAIQNSNSQEFKSLYKHNDDKFNKVMDTIKETSERLESKIDKLSDNLTTHIIEHHG